MKTIVYIKVFLIALFTPTPKFTIIPGTIGSVVLKLLVWGFISLPLFSFGQPDTTIANHYFKKVYPARPVVRNERTGVKFAEQIFNRADSLSKAAQYDSAIFYFEKAGEIYLSIAQAGEKEPPTIQSSGDLIAYKKYLTCQNKIAQNYRDKAQYDIAISILKNIINTGIELFEKNDFIVGSAYNALGLIYWQMGRYDEALDKYNQALEIAKFLYGNIHPAVASTYNNIGIIYKDVFGGYHPNVGRVYRSIAAIYTAQSKYDTALVFFQKAIGALVAPSPDLRKQGIGTHYKTIYENPVIPTIYDVKEGRNTINSNIVLKDALVGKAEAFYEKWLIKK